MATIHYKANAVPDFGTLVDQPFNLKSPSRSTVPLLAYWSDFEAQLAHFGDAIQLPISNDASLTFEFTVSPTEGRGFPSHTDLMIRSPVVAIANEAKYTEGKYESVAEWLGTPATDNKLRVLGGWLDTINRVTGAALLVEQVQEITYQLIHRTASACTPQAEKRAVVYHLFDPVDDQREYYSEQLQAIATLLGEPEGISFLLYETTMAKTPAYAQLQARWLANESRDLSTDVRNLLKQRTLATFSPPVVVRFPLPVQASEPEVT